jgi:putative ABC transport system permease protein
LGLVTALIAAVIGSVAAWLVLTKVMHAEWHFLPQAVLATTALSVAVTLVLGFLSTWQALGAKAALFLRNE